MNFDLDRQIYAWRHEQRGENSPTLRISRAVLENYPAVALMEHIARLRAVDAIRREPGAKFPVAQEGARSCWCVSDQPLDSATAVKGRALPNLWPGLGTQAATPASWLLATPSEIPPPPRTRGAK